jgi:acyl-coenzyme A synthetase/AMP-(fatty) acid ligase
MSVVPPILIQLLNKLDDCAKYDLSSIRIVYTGAAPLASETAEDVLKAFPKWRICQAYGTYILLLYTTTFLLLIHRHRFN